MDDLQNLKMVKLFHNSVLVIAFFSVISIDVKLVGSMPHASDDILEINVDGTAGFLRGKKLTTLRFSSILKVSFSEKSMNSFTVPLRLCAL